MTLSADQLEIIRRCTVDDAAYHEIRGMLQAASAPPRPEPFDEAHRQFLLSLFDPLPIAIYVKDTDNRFLLANRATLEMLSLATEADVLGKRDHDLLPAALASRYYETERQVLETGVPLLNEESLWTSPNGEIWHWQTHKVALRTETGAISGLMGVTLDVTGRKHADAAVLHERNLLRTVIDHIQDKIYVKDRESRFVLTNTATLRAHGVDEDQLLGQSDSILFPAHLAEIFREVERDVMITGKPLIDHEHRIPLDDLVNPGRWMLSTKLPLYDTDGMVQGLVGIHRDITEHKQAQERKLALQMERERGAILGAFITKASHEFRTPLAVINTSLYLTQRAKNETQRARYLGRAQQQVSHIEDLIETLMLMVRLDRKPQIERRPVRLNSLLQLVGERILPEQAHAPVSLEFGPQDVHPSGDEVLLARALSALLDNAIRHTPTDGAITLRYHVREDGWHALGVIDTGEGMSDAVQLQATQRFFRADHAHATRGLGLGLALVQRIAELHGGRLVISSTEGVGTRVEILLPPTPEAD